VPSEVQIPKAEAQRFARYLLAGGAAAVANYGSRFLFSVWVPFEAAVILAFLVGLGTGFVLMRQYVFDAAGKPARPQAVRYVGVNMLALVQTLIVSSLLARWLLPLLGIALYAEAIAHAFGVAVPVVTSYFGHRNATFR
jgi:putative flippase GtrA